MDKEDKLNCAKNIFVILIVIIILVVYTKQSFVQSSNYSPRFNSQWQQATAWIKHNTTEDSVFAHWWDYGYWIQTMGERATLSDGGNALPYLNHYIGRHIITAQNPEEALTFLKTYGADYVLLSYKEILKYPSISSIGSDKEDDRLSKFGVFSVYESLPEKTDKMSFLYIGIWNLDNDIIYKDEVFTKENSKMIGVLLSVKESKNSSIFEQPIAIIDKNSVEKRIPIECVIYNNEEIIFDKKGLKGCFQIIGLLKDGNYYEVGAGIYISEMKRNILITQMLLFDKELEGFEKVYDDYSPFLLNYHIGKLEGPLKIWKINYPDYIKTKPNYLNLSLVPEGLE